MYKSILFALLSVVAEDVFAFHCYPDYCKNFTFLPIESDNLCSIEPVKRGEDCKDLKFEHMGHAPPPGQPLAKVKLTAYVTDFEELNIKTTAFNFSIANINFDKLVTRYQSLGGEESACRHVEFSRKLHTEAPNFFYVSCPFSNRSFENSQYRLEYLISSKNYEYSRKLVFIVPNHRYIDTVVRDVSLYTPFIYVDVSDGSILTVYIQLLPEKFDISKYKIWMLNKENLENVKEVTVEKLEGHDQIRYSFPVEKGTYYFKVTALHPICREYGCVNSTSPFINIKQQESNKILIMIISVVWIPPVILYAMYNAYKLYKKKEFLKSRTLRKLKCLLIYSPTHMSHVYTMVELAKYLRGSNIDAMIDTLDIPETTHKDPVLWCNDAFHSADVVIVATSPKTNEIAQVVYRNMDSQALRLIKENYPHHNKKYYVIEFPYCDPNDVPKDARHFKRFSMPDDLRKLVRAIYDADFVPFCGVHPAEFENSVKWAQMTLPIDVQKNFETTDIKEDYEYSKIKEKTVSSETIHKKEFEINYDDAAPDTTSPKRFRTNIEELNLLGENDSEASTTVFNPTISSSGFRIDTLNL
ncbi:uncharacterized protein LOC106635760 isoform X2 [Copidosoma floridanum]|uniref:uncharacterized protein LOC106635760 isoform X1 n=1 Tax=Copidosoma floridanum TaxID=29053 RepID=UPI000C6FC651|nr:uncharacterized protein LOC106635760 isoform X1 [Copidosoma floridanum]XP_023247432.1 uncharacterized protein LOC106635760 isoform X2 [Copidosoma floridanum]